MEVSALQVPLWCYLCYRLLYGGTSSCFSLAAILQCQHISKLRYVWPDTQEEIDLKSYKSPLKSIKQTVRSLIPRHRVFYRTSTLESPRLSSSVEPTVSSLPAQKWPLIRLHLDTAALRKPNRKWNCDQCFKRDRKAEPWLTPRGKTLSSL